MFAILLSLLLIGLWIAGIVWAILKRKDRRATILILAIFFGPIGWLIAMMIADIPEPEDMESKRGMDGILDCPHCDYPYRISDYQPGVRMLCSRCKQELPQQQMQGVPIEG